MEEQMNQREQPPGDCGGPPDPDAGHPRLEEAYMWNVVSYLISGPVVFAGIGWALDHWLGTAFFVPLGILTGMFVSLYLVWFRYGTHQ
jgi:F0F1-type ATP synthase assembly protein I